ncbi:MAG: bifunctional UDP-sugar hydrolase/5'-nucleotidase [Candidatus Marinimicrobia bacterium]|nr:bifunctional UDP-sugar hydrolase/5'-nucleotidase [Candidatus Neomarinimicrobiota bacterium]
MKYFNIIVIGVLFVLMSCSAPSADITILHWNDFHSHNITWVPTNYNNDKHAVGGYALFDAYLDSLENVYPGALRVHAGDDFQGSPMCAVSEGLSQIEILNLVQPDFFAIGNHEFDYSWSHLDSLRLNAANFAMYAANLIDVNTGESAVPQFRIFMRKGYRFALIGLTHPGLDLLTMPQNLKGIEVTDPVLTTQNLINTLGSRGIDLFVVVSHMGIGADRRLAEAVPEIDLIVGGHSHTYMREAENVNGVWIVQADDHGRYIGVTKFHVDEGKITTLNMDYVETVVGKLKPSKDVAEIVDSYEAELSEIMDEVIGSLERHWKAGGAESNLGNWIADAFREAAGTDIAMMNNGGIRKSLNAGNILVRDIWEIAPFGNTLVTFEWTGKELIEALNYMAKQGRSMQVSGIDMMLERNKGLVDAIVGEAEIDINKTYSLCVNNYTASQGEKYFGKKIESTETGLIDRDVLIEAVRKDPIINSGIEGRVIIL